MDVDWTYRTALANIVWPGFPQQSAANKLALLFQMEQNQWRPPEHIEARQFEQIRKLVDFAATTVPHYRKTIGRRFPAQALNPRSWIELPVLTRRHLHEDPTSIRSENVPQEHGKSFSITTSGSTGMIVELLGTELTNIYWQVLCLRDHLWHRRDLGTRLCAIRYRRDPADKGEGGLKTPGWGPATDDLVVTGPAFNYHILLEIDHLVGKLVSDRPGYLLSHPSVIAGLASYCLDHGVTLPELKEVRTMGETPDEALRELCQRAWSVPLTDMYTCQEAGYLALQCPEHPHYHVQSENVLLEVVDDKGRPCAPGEIGRVLVTCLNNFATPLIRYEIGDYAEVGGPCSCGRGLPVLKRIMGRYRNLLVLPDGTRRWPRLGYESRLQDIAPIELMQMIQREPELIEVRLVMPRPLSETERENLAGFIRKNLGHPFRLRFEYVDSIRNPANGKIEQFISMVAAAR